MRQGKKIFLGYLMNKCVIHNCNEYTRHPSKMCDDHWEQKVITITREARWLKGKYRVHTTEAHGQKLDSSHS